MFVNVLALSAAQLTSIYLKSGDDMERKQRGKDKAPDESEGEDGDALAVGPKHLNESAERASKRGTVQGAKAKLHMPLVSPAVGYRIEGGGLSEEDLATSSASSSSGAVIDDVFDLEGKDNDFKFYQQKFLNKGNGEWCVATMELPLISFPFFQESITTCCARIQR